MKLRHAKTYTRGRIRPKSAWMLLDARSKKRVEVEARLCTKGWCFKSHKNRYPERTMWLFSGYNPFPF